MRYEAVIFDLFGTLIQTVSPDDYQRMLAEVAGALRVDSDTFAGVWRATVDERESGFLGGISEILGHTSGAAGRTASAVEIADARLRWLAITREWLTPRNDARATLEVIRGMGVKVGLLSNCSAEVPTLWSTITIADLFDSIVFSCELGAMKPNSSTYQAVAKNLGFNPTQCMFVGDGGARELSGASAVGMKACLLRVPGEEYAWFDSFYREDALEWKGTTVGSLSQLPSMV